MAWRTPVPSYPRMQITEVLKGRALIIFIPKIISFEHFMTLHAFIYKAYLDNQGLENN